VTHNHYQFGEDLTRKGLMVRFSLPWSTSPGSRRALYLFSSFRAFIGSDPLSSTMSLQASLTYSSPLLGWFTLVTATEWLWLHREFSGGAFAWRILSSRPSRFFSSFPGRALFSAGSVSTLLLVRAAAGVSLLLVPSVPAILVAAVLSLLTGAYMTIRVPVGGDGSDQMGAILSTGIALIAAGIQFSGKWLAVSGCVLITGQYVLAYSVAAVSKLVSPSWRTGAAIVGVLRTRAYGVPALIPFLARSRPLAAAACWLVIALELVLPLAIVLPRPLALLVLGGGVMLHVVLAFIMGLNTFVPAFIGTYPCVLVVREWLVG
jgi:hypothetical protein